MKISYRWLSDTDAVAALATGVDHGQRLYVDTEFMRERTFFPTLALVQVNDGRDNHLIDPLPLTDPAPLAALVTRGTLVMHGCSEDLETLRTAPGVLPHRLEDTQVGAALVGFDLQCGYQRIVAELVGVELPKTATRTDWLQRPLSPQQLEYAVQDVHYLPAVHAEVVERLERAGRMDWWREECERLLRDAAREPDPETLWQGVKGAVMLDGPGRRRLRALAIWRDAQARRANLPRGFVIRDEQLVAIAAANPAGSGALAGLGLHPSALRRHGETLLALLAQAEEGPEPAPLPGPPEPALRDLVKRLRARTAEIAAALELTPEVLMRRKWLEALVRHPDDLPEPLLGWRRDVITRPLLEVLS